MMTDYHDQSSDHNTFNEVTAHLYLMEANTTV